MQSNTTTRRYVCTIAHMHVRCNMTTATSSFNDNHARHGHGNNGDGKAITASMVRHGHRNQQQCRQQLLWTCQCGTTAMAATATQSLPARCDITMATSSSINDDHPDTPVWHNDGKVITANTVRLNDDPDTHAASQWATEHRQRRHLPATRRGTMMMPVCSMQRHNGNDDDCLQYAEAQQQHPHTTTAAVENQQ